MYPKGLIFYLTLGIKRLKPKRPKGYGVCMAIPWAHVIEAWGGHGRAKGRDRQVGTVPYMKEAPSLSL